MFEPTRHSVSSAAPNGYHTVAAPARSTANRRTAVVASVDAEVNNPLLDWFEELSLRVTRRPLEEIIARASALVCELGDLLPFASGDDALAFALLDEFARDRLLHPAEVAMLMVNPVQQARAAIRELVEEHDDLVAEIARLDRAMSIRRRGGADPTARRDRGQVRR